MREYDFGIDEDGDLCIDCTTRGEYPYYLTELEDAYALLHEVIEFIKLKETSNDEQN